MHQPETVTSFGELLIDRFSTQKPDGTEQVLDAFGGAPANTALGLAKLDITVNFIGKIGNDSAGSFLQQILKQHHVDIEGLVVSDTEPTTVAFVALTAKGERSFTFQKGAHATIQPDEVSLPPDTAIFHFGSLTQIDASAASTTEKLLFQAREVGALVSYDPNVREALWKDLARARQIILETAKKVDMLKVNEEEALLLAQTETIEEAANALFTPNLQLLLITLAERGCYYKTAEFEGIIPALAVNVVDTTGAGDAFNAGVIAGIYRAGKKPQHLSQQELEDILRRAVVIGSLTTTKKGAITAFPTIQEIETHLS